ncbi:MAG: putative MPP superfamily phosphohydrolase [Planctomycetota bacterium]|jgi:predicted MPP superfamily phosphohydrolase
MLPYVELQLYYFLIAALPALIVWFSSRSLAAKPWQRLFYASFVIAAIELGLSILIDGHVGFRVVAFLLYGNCISVPLLALGAAFKRRQNHRRQTLVISTLCALALTTVAYALFVEPNRLQERHEIIIVSKWTNGETLRIAHISDLQTVGFTERESRALEMINSYEPDLIIFTGDYIAGPFDNVKPAVDAARSFLKALRPKIATIVLDGHSEPDAHRANIFAGLDLIHLRNQEQTFAMADGRKVHVLGLSAYHPHIPLLNRERPKEDLFIVASHVPDVTRGMTGKNVDLHLAGHTHGGQIVIPGFGALVTLSSLPRKYARGLHKHGDHWINICAGIGMEGNHAPRIRLFCPPEVTFIEMKAAEIPQ